MKKAEYSKYLIYEKNADSNMQYWMYKMYNVLLAIKYKIKFKFMKVDVSEKKYNVSVGAIFKNEAPYLKEWIEFNHLVGVEHFYLYNNNSEDDYKSVLSEYIESGLVTLIDWPHNQAQMRCYKDCIKHFKEETKWLGFIDIDEFIVPKKDNDIYTFLKPFEKKCGAVKIYWKMFGTSGLMDRDLNGLVTEAFTVAWPKHYEVGKCFYNTALDFDYETNRNDGLHHLFWANYKGKNIPPVNEFNKVCIGNVNKVTSDDFPIQINHYFTKSYKEYAMKRAKGDVYFKINPHDEEYFYFHEMLCDEVDYSIFKYLVKLKLAMGRQME